jgi:hypothetical protein
MHSSSDKIRKIDAIVPDQGAVANEGKLNLAITLSLDKEFVPEGRTYVEDSSEVPAIGDSENETIYDRIWTPESKDNLRDYRCKLLASDIRLG